MHAMNIAIEIPCGLNLMDIGYAEPLNLELLKRF